METKKLVHLNEDEIESLKNDVINSNLFMRRRQELGYSLQQIADGTGIPAASIGSAEKKPIKNVKLGTAFKLAKFLDIDPKVFELLVLDK